MKKSSLSTIIILIVIVLFVASLFITNEPTNVNTDEGVEIDTGYIPAYGVGPQGNRDLSNLVVVEGVQVVVADYFIGMQYYADKECYVVTMHTFPINHAFTTGVEQDCVDNFGASFIPLEEVIAVAEEAGLEQIDPDSLIAIDP